MPMPLGTPSAKSSAHLSPTHAGDHGGRLPSIQLFLVALVVGFGGSFHFGFQLTVTNPSQAAFIGFLNDSFNEHYRHTLTKQNLDALWSVIVACLFFGAIFGSLWLRQLADRIGRKMGIVFAYALSAISLTLAILSSFVNSFELFAISRLALGMSLALSLGVAAIFLTESSPKRCRGSINMTTGVLLQLGTVLGSVVGMPLLLGTRSRWWVIFAVELAFLLFTLAILPFMHDSPGYLLLLGYESRARASIRFYYDLDPKRDAQRLDRLVMELKENMMESSKRSIGMFGLVRRGGIDLRGTIVGSVVGLAMAFSGIVVVNAFAVEIFRNTGLSMFHATLANVGLSLVSLTSNIVSASLIDRFGRRRLLLFSTSGIFLLNLCVCSLMFVYERYAYSWIGGSLIVAISFFIVAFSCGVGPLCYFITAEMVHQNVRSAAQSWTWLCIMTSRAFLLTAYLPLRNAVGNGASYLMMFVVPILASFAFLYFCLPETKNRNMQEVRREIALLPKLPRQLCRRRKTNKISVAVLSDDESPQQKSSLFAPAITIRQTI